MSNNAALNTAPFLLNSADSDLPNSVVFPAIFIPSSTAPTDTRFGWYNTTDLTLYYYSVTTSSWTAITGSTAATPLYVMLTAGFSAGATGATNLIVTVAVTSIFNVGMFATIIDNTLTYCVYQMTAIDTSTNEITLTRIDQNAVSSTYEFTVANGAFLTIGGAGSSSGSGGGGASLTVDPYIVTVVGIPALSWITSSFYIANFGDISSILASDNCLVRCYVNETCMLADTNRIIGTAPLPSSGIISGDIYCGAGISVPISFGDFVSENLYLNVYNYQSFTESITLTFTSSNA